MSFQKYDGIHPWRQNPVSVEHNIESSNSNEKMSVYQHARIVFTKTIIISYKLKWKMCKLRWKSLFEIIIIHNMESGRENRQF